MSYSDYLSDKQFPSAQEQGKPVAEWLATDEGHQWQDKHRKGSMGFDNPDQRYIRSPEGYHHPSNNSQIEYINSFFSVKQDDRDRGDAENPVFWAGHAQTRWPEPYSMQSNLDYLDEEDRRSGRDFLG